MRTNIRPPLPPAVCADTLIFVNLSVSRLASATLLIGTLCCLACQRHPAANLAPTPSVPPTIVNKVPSIQVDLAGQDLQGYTLSLRNISFSRAVLAYAVDQGQDSWREFRSVGTRPVIASGAARKQLIVRNTPGGQMTPRGFVKEPASDDITLAAAIFSDGSHEGDDQFAARLQTRQIANEIQYRRLAPVIDRIVHDSTLDDATRTAQIREQLHNLSNQANEATLRAMTSQFPNLPHQTVAKDLREGLDAARQNIWSSLYSHVHSSGTYPRRSIRLPWPSGGAGIAKGTENISAWQKSRRVARLGRRFENYSI